MNERTDNYRFYLTSETDLGTRLIEEPRDFDKDSLVYELQEQGRYFSKTRDEQITFLESGRDYLITALELYGPDTEIRLITKVKDDRPLEDGFAEQWKTISNVGVDLYTLNFDEEPDNQQVSVDLITGGVLKRIESRFKDEYDITAETTVDDTGVVLQSDLDFKTICLDPRRIFRRSRLRVTNEQGPLFVLSTDTLFSPNNEQPFSLPLLDIILDSDAENFRASQWAEMPTVGGTYAKVVNPFHFFYYNSDRQREISINSRVKFSVEGLPINTNIRVDLVKYEG